MKYLIAAAVAAPAGALLLAGHVAAPVNAAQSDAPRGATLFKQRCATCHAISGTGGKMGPDLTGVAGRKAGSTDFAYSSAMKSSKTVWNERTLDAYLAAPRKAMPGTRMVISVANADDREAIVRYLMATSR